MSKTREERRELWRQLIAQQQQSGVSVRAFCQQRRTSEYSFYQWRKRLAQQLPVRFALVETSRSAASTTSTRALDRCGASCSNRNTNPTDYNDIFVGRWKPNLAEWSIPEAPGLGVDFSPQFLKERTIKV